MSSSHIVEQKEKYWKTQHCVANVAPLVRYTVSVILMWLQHPLAITCVSRMDMGIFA